MHDSLITRKEYASKDWTCVISMFLTSFDVLFCVWLCMFYVYTVCLKTVIWLFVTFLGEGLDFFGEDRLATMLCSSARFDLGNPSVRQPVQPHIHALLRIRRYINAASFCSCNLPWRSDECALLHFFNTQPKFCSHVLLCRSIEFIFLRYPNLESW